MTVMELIRFVPPSRLRVGALAALCLVGAGSLVAADLEVRPAEGYLATGLARGRFDPPEKVYTLTNTSAAEIEWAINQNGAWFSTLESHGRLAPGSETNVVVFPNSLSLDLGADLFEGLLTVTNVGAGESETRSVSLKVSLPGPGEVEPVQVSLEDYRQLVFSGPPGSFYVLEESTNLIDWAGVETNVFGNEPSRFEFDVTEVNPRYFRSHTTDTNAPPSTLTLTDTLVVDLDRVRLIGEALGTYLVESSSDGVEWTPILTNQVPSTGSSILTNHVTGGDTGLTYRASALGPFPTEDLHHVLITGQSLALGATGAPALSTTPSDRHYRFYSDGTYRVLTPLVETGLETIASGAGQHLTRSHPEHRLLFGNSSVGGATYEFLKKGTAPYNLALAQFRDAPFAVSSVLLGYQPSAIFVIHGEGDHINLQYDEDLREWQEDYERDWGAVSGQPRRIPMFHTQASAWTSPGNGSAEFTLGAFLLLEESRLHPDRTILVGPKYMFTYSDGIHLVNSSYRWLGEYYATAYRSVVVEGGSWTPLQPLSVTRSNTVVTAVFHVPVPPLVLDTNLVSDPGQYGFTYHDGTLTPPAVESVELTSADTVRVVLASPPLGLLPEFLRYAYSAAPGSWGGPLTGPRGNLRDSDDEASTHGNTLHNWCVHFNEPVTVAPEP